MHAQNILLPAHIFKLTGETTMTTRTTTYLSTITVALFLTACGGGGGGPGAGGGGNGGSTSGTPVAGTGTIPDSGQTTCFYDTTIDGIYNPSEFTCLAPGSAWQPDGQDGYYAINSMSFTDNGDGTVLDNTTQLTWQKCSMGESGTDCSTGSNLSYTWNDARNQCTNLSLAGGGWRLPTVFELTQIVDYSDNLGTIDAAVFPGTALAPYWTSTAHANTSTGWSWYVGFAEGTTWANNQSQTYNVRCVKG